MSTLANAIKLMIEDRCHRDDEMHEQMDLLQRLVVERTVLTGPIKGTIEGESSLKLTCLSDHDIEAYLMTFERMMRVYEVDRAQWVFKLAPQLTGKAQ